MRFRHLAVVAILLTPTAAHAADPITTATPYPGIVYSLYELVEPSARVHVVEVDLRSTEIDLVATTEAAKGQTVSHFAEASSTQVVINGDSFDPDGFRPAGLARGTNADWSQTADSAATGFVSFLRGASRVELEISPPEEVLPGPLAPSVVGVVSGRPMLVRDGASTGAADCTDLVALACLSAPRTAIGRSMDGDAMWLVVVDGWQAGSLGMTSTELGAFLVDLGVHDALMLDGGSASALHVGAMGGLVSSPSDGVERSVANHLAVRHTPMVSGVAAPDDDGAATDRDGAGGCQLGASPGAAATLLLSLALVGRRRRPATVTCRIT